MALIHDADPRGTIDELVLIVTDQPTTALSRFRNEDTVHCGKLIAELCSRDPKIGSSSLFVISDPTDADAVYATIRGLSHGQVRSGQHWPVVRLADRRDASDIAGPASCSHKRLRRSVYHDKRSRTAPAIQRAELPVERRSGIPHPYLKDAIRLGARALIQADNYAGAIAVLTDFGPHWHDALIPLLQHAAARVNLSRGKARSAADIVRARMMPVPSDLDRCLSIPSGPFADLGFTNEVRFLIDAALRPGTVRRCTVPHRPVRRVVSSAICGRECSLTMPASGKQ